MRGRTEIKEDILRRVRGKIALVGLGNIIRGDDGLGPKLIELLKERNTQGPIFDGGTAPENYIFPILSASADTVILVDAADIGLQAGDIKVVDLEEIKNVSFSTHNASPRLFADLLMTGKDDLNIFAVTVQPGDTTLGSSISKDVMTALETLAEIFTELFRN